jgi:uncharacterized membrane protein
MLKRVACAAGFFLLAPFAVASEVLPDLLIVGPQAEMEKCFALPDAKPKECAVDPDSEDCKAAEKKPKDGTEFKYVRRGSCTKQGGELVMNKRPKPQK